MTTDPNNNKDDDELLRAAFADLKREDRRHGGGAAGALPSFESMWRPRPARSPFVVLVPIASALAAAAVLIVYCGVSSLSSSPAPLAPVASSGGGAGGGGGAIGGEAPAVAARMPDALPLDFLLETSTSVQLSSLSPSSSSSPRSPLHGW